MDLSKLEKLKERLLASGYEVYAYKVSNLIRLAQESPEEEIDSFESLDSIEEKPEDMAESSSEEPSDNKNEEKLKKSIFLQFKAFEQVFSEIIDGFDYMGEDNVAVLRQAFSILMDSFEKASKELTLGHYEDLVADYKDHLRLLRREILRLSKRPLTKLRVKQERYLLPEEVYLLQKKFERNFVEEETGAIDPRFKNIHKSLNNFVLSFDNVIDKGFEEITNTELDY